MMNRKQIISIGVALFAMFFGAGNVVFPLDLGRTMGDKVTWAVLGLFISAVLMPLAGVLGGAVFEGDYHAFFRRIGFIPGELVALMCMLLIGPFGATPRTLTIAHAALAWYFPETPLWVFTIVAAAVILLFTLREGTIIDVIGRVLGPIKVALLSAVIISGFLEPSAIKPTNYTPFESFFMGLREGYMTLDLLGAMFLGKLILVGVDRSKYHSSSRLVYDLFKASCIGAIMLGVIYIGFMIVGAFHGTQVPPVPRETLIYALSDYLMGPLGFLSSITVAVACMVTAIALTAIFSDYLRNIVNGLLGERITYGQAVVGSVTVTCVMANLGFGGIMDIIAPIAVICYPAVIVLTFCNIAYKLIGFKPVKVPFYSTLVLSFIAKYLKVF